MSKKQYVLLVVLVVIAGFLGGGVFTAFFGTQSAWGDKTPYSPTNIVSAEEFHLVDKNGNILAKLCLNQFGRWGLFLSSKEGHNRIEMAVGDETEPDLSICDKTGEPRASLGLVGNEKPGLFLDDKDGKWLVMLEVEEDGASLDMSEKQGGLGVRLQTSTFAGAWLHLSSKDEQHRISLGANKGEGTLCIDAGKESNKRFMLSLEKDSPSVMTFCDNDGKLRAGLDLMNNGAPSLWLGDKNGHRRSELKIGWDEQPRLEFLDEGHKTIWSAPQMAK